LSLSSDSQGQSWRCLVSVWGDEGIDGGGTYGAVLSAGLGAVAHVIFVVARPYDRSAGGLGKADGEDGEDLAWLGELGDWALESSCHVFLMAPFLVFCFAFALLDRVRAHS